MFIVQNLIYSKISRKIKFEKLWLTFIWTNFILVYVLYTYIQQIWLSSSTPESGWGGLGFESGSYQPVACAGFILAGAEKIFRGGRKKNQGGQTQFSCPPRQNQFCPPRQNLILPPRQNSILPLGQNRQEGGQKTLLYLEKEGETFNDRSLSNPELTVLLFL